MTQTIFAINGSPIKFGNTFLSITPSGAQPLTITGITRTISPTYGFGNIGGVFATGGYGNYSFSGTSAQSSVSYEVDGGSGNITVYNGGNQVTAPFTDTFTVTVTDSSGQTASTICTVNYVAGYDTILPTGNMVFYTSQSTNGGVTFESFNAVGPDVTSNTSNPTITDTTGNFSGQVYLYQHLGQWTAGAFPITVSTTNPTISVNYTVNVITDNGPAYVNWSQTIPTLTSSRIAGTVVGQFLAEGSPLTTTYALSNNASGKYSINGSTGIVSTAGPLTAGTDVITVLATRSGLSRSATAAITVTQGNTLPASNMTMTVNSLTNIFNNGNVVAVGNPSVTGVTGTKVWTMDQTNRSLINETSYLIGYPVYEINSSTGAVTSRATLSAQTDTLTISCTDGTNTCTQTFNVTPTAISGPTIYVGEGMAAAHGSNGYEHFNTVYNIMNSKNSSLQGATIYIESNPDPNYYANDNTDNNDLSRFGMYGPVTIIGVQGSLPNAPARPRMGGTVGSLNTGVDEGGKGFIVTSGGDCSFQNIEFSDVHVNGYQGGVSPESGETGCAIRQNAACFGNFTLRDCYIHDCDQGIQTGSIGIVTIDTCEIANCGGEYVSSGATHNIYIGENPLVVVNNLLTWKTVNGHTFKSRAYAGTITNSRFYDSERGSASCQLEIPNGGTYTVSNCTFHKGAMPQNPNSVQFTAEMTMPINAASLAISNCTFICNTPTGFPGYNAIYMFGQCLTSNGVYSTCTSTNNSFIGYPNGAMEVAVFNGNNGQYVTGVSDGRPCAVTSTGRTVLTTQPALSFLNPQTGSVTPRTGPLYVCYDGESRNNWVNFYNFWIDPQSEDLRYSASSTTNGTVLFTPTILPAPYSTGATNYVNPMASGAVWSLITNAGPYVGGTYGVAPAGRYSINASTGAFTVVTVPAAGTIDNFNIRVTSSDGTIIFAEMFYIVWI